MLAHIEWPESPKNWLDWNLRVQDPPPAGDLLFPMIPVSLSTENGERRTENGERRTENGERRTENGERMKYLRTTMRPSALVSRQDLGSTAPGSLGHVANQSGIEK